MTKWTFGATVNGGNRNGGGNGNRGGNGTGKVNGHTIKKMH